MAMRQLKIFEVLFLCFLVLLVACGPVSRSNVKAALDDVESYINDRPDSALAVLRGLDSTAVIRRPAQRARAALLCRGRARGTTCSAQMGTGRGGQMGTARSAQ